MNHHGHLFNGALGRYTKYGSEFGEEYHFCHFCQQWIPESSETLCIGHKTEPCPSGGR